MCIKSVVSLSFLFLISPVLLFSQSDHYWSQSFNTESSLVAGAVVGGAAGPSSVYFNPALITKEENKVLSLSANLLSVRGIELINLAGENTNFVKTFLQVQPKFLSYNISSKKNDRLNFEFAFLTPLSDNIQFNYLYNKNYDIIKRIDGNEDYFGNLTYQKKYNDYYFGGGCSYQLSDHWSIGASAFISTKVMDYNSVKYMNATQRNDSIYSNGIIEASYSPSVTYEERLNYWDMSLITKLGIHYYTENKRIGIGLNFTLPNIHIYGEGKNVKRYSRSSIYNNEEATFLLNKDFVSHAQHILTNVKDPFSVSFGFELTDKTNTSKLLFTMEYFASIDPYQVLDIRQINYVGNIHFENINNTMNYYWSASSVMNFALGYIHIFSDKFTLSGGVKTDFNVNASNDNLNGDDFFENKEFESSVGKIYFDKMHFILGPVFRIKTFGILLGLQYTWGRGNDLYNIVNFTEAVEYNEINGTSLQGPRQNNMRIRYNELSFFFGLSYGFVKK